MPIETIDVAKVIEDQKPGRFLVGLVLLSWLVTFFDGYDMNVIAFTRDGLTAGFHLTNAKLGLVFSFGVAGTIISGLIFGYLGDRLGRRPATILATASFSVLTLALAFATEYWHLLALRLLGGIALGGAIPLVWALNIEFVPARLRATVVTVIMVGYGVGSSVAGPVSRLLVPRFGWQGVFVFGGLASFAATLLLLMLLPESARFLASKGLKPATVRRVLLRLAPDGNFPADARYVVSDERTTARAFRPAMLFAGRLKAITPLTWAAYFSTSVSTFLLTYWGPTILNQIGFNLDNAALVTAGNSLCSAAGGLAIMSFTDRRGIGSIAILPAIAIPLLLVVGLAPLPLGAFVVLSFCLSIFLGGSHYAVQSICGLFYPSAIRSNGVGWASGVAKIGSFLGPIIGAAILDSHIEIRHTYALLAICPTAFGVCILALGRLQRRGLADPDEALKPDPAGPTSALAYSD